MRISRTLSIHVMRETLLYCTLAFLVLTLVLLTQNLLRRLDDLFQVGMTLADVSTVIQCIAPIAFSYSIPLALLIGILLAIRRMSTDGELLALRAVGLSPLAFLIPFLALGMLATSLSAWILNSVEYASRAELVLLFKHIAARGAIIEPGKFMWIGRHQIFVDGRDRDGTLSGVMLHDPGRLHPARDDRPEAEPNNQRGLGYRIFAAQGQFVFDASTYEIQLDLRDGDIHFDPHDEAPRRYERIHFETFSYRLGVGHLIGTEFGPTRPKQMTAEELRTVLVQADAGDPLSELNQRDPIEYALEIHRRSALPFAPLLFVAIGVPIALISEHRGRNLGLLFVLAAAFGYYALGSLCEAMALGGWISPAPARWFPNLFFLGFSLVLAQTARNRIPE